MYSFSWDGVKNTFTIWNPPGAIRPDEGFNSYFIYYLSFSCPPTMGSFRFKAQSQGISFKLRNLKVIIFLWPQRVLPKSRTPSVTPSITISGIVRLATRSSLYLAPFFISKITDDLSLPNLLDFFVAKVTTMLTYSPGASFDLSGVMLYSVALIGFKSNIISIGWSPTFLNFSCLRWVLPTITLLKSQIQVVK